jgi:signal transduction histidine kinase
VEKPETAEKSERAGDKQQEGEHEDNNDAVFFEVWGDGPTVLARSASLQDKDLPFMAGVDTDEEHGGLNITLPSGRRGRAVQVRFRPQPADRTIVARAAPVSLMVAMDRGEMDATLDSAALILVGVGSVLLLAMAVLVPTVLRRGLAPLDALAQQASGINAASLSTRFASDGLPGELAPISARLNDLLARLEASFERERRFSGDLAHELRTPIAELRSLAEVAMKWPDARPADTDREALAIALQLDGIVSRLLSLLRSERGELLVERRSIDLEAEIGRACNSVADRGLTRGLQLAPNVQAGSTAIVDAVLLRSILSNLLDNAVEYAPDNTEIEIDATGQGEQFAIRVSNHTGDLRPEDVPNLFDRFWRRSAARSDSSHSGLGLPIARAFAEAMDCTLTASVENGRVTFTLARGTSL